MVREKKMVKKLQWILFEKRWNIFLFFGIVGIYLINFWAITKSGYRCDDCYNSNIVGVCQITGTSLFDITKGSIEGWMDMGRFFPFSGYTYYMFAIFSTRFAYKFAILCMTLINSVVFGKYVEKFTGSKKLNYLIVLLFPILIPLSCEYNSGLYAYHALAHMIFLWITLSWIMLLKFMESNKIRYNILSGIFLFMALGTYEVAFVLVLVHAITVWIKQRNIKKTLKILSLDIIVYIVTVLINLYLRMNAGGSTYDGTAFGFKPSLIFSGFVKQLSSSVPLVRSYYTYVKDLGKADFLWTVAHNIHVTDVVLIALIGIMAAVVIYKLKKDQINLKGKVMWIFLIGAAIFTLPAFIVALSGKYQVETQMGMGHLPSYIQSFGFTLIFVMIIYLIYNKLNKWLRMVFIVLVASMLVFILCVNQFMARATVKGENVSCLYPRDNVEASIRAGILDEVTSDKQLLVSTDYVIDTLGPMVFYTHIADRVIQTKPIIDYKDNQILGNEYSLFSNANENAGYVILGEFKKLYLDKTRTKVQRIDVQKALIYLQGDYENAEYISVSKTSDSETGEATNSLIKIKDLIIVNQTGEGTLYKIPSDAIFDIQTIYIY